MRHEHGDNTGMTTNELISVLVSRTNAPSCLFSLLALMTEVSVELPIERQYMIAGSLRDAAEIIEQRPEVRDWADRLGLAPAYREAMQCRR
jgi:hypothetical protein